MFGLNDKGQASFDANVVCAVLASVSVVTRMFCKIQSKQGISSDDYWILGALVCYLTAVGFAIWGIITGGGGLEMQDIMALIFKNPNNMKLLENYLQSMFLAWLFVTTSIYAVKISILCFYRRIFWINKGFQRASLALIVVSTAWFTATQLANLLTCQPIDSFWHRLKPGKCFNFNAMFLGTGIADATIDTAILLFPIQMAFQLQLPRRTKIAVAGIFALGGFVVVTQIIRIAYIYQPGARYVQFHQAELWTNIHDASAIICACFPIYKPLWSSVSKSIETVFRQYASSIRSRLRGSDSKISKSYSHGMERLGSSRDSGSHKYSGRSYPSKSESELEHTTVSVVGGMDDDTQRLHVPKGNIAYARGVDIV